MSARPGSSSTARVATIVPPPPAGRRPRRARGGSQPANACPGRRAQNVFRSLAPHATLWARPRTPNSCGGFGQPRCRMSAAADQQRISADQRRCWAVLAGGTAGRRPARRPAGGRRPRGCPGSWVAFELVRPRLLRESAVCRRETEAIPHLTPTVPDLLRRCRREPTSRPSLHVWLRLAGCWVSPSPGIAHAVGSARRRRKALLGMPSQAARRMPTSQRLGQMRTRPDGTGATPHDCPRHEPARQPGPPG